MLIYVVHYKKLKILKMQYYVMVRKIQQPIMMVAVGITIIYNNVRVAVVAIHHLDNNNHDDNNIHQSLASRRDSSNPASRLFHQTTSATETKVLLSTTDIIVDIVFTD